MHEHKMWAWKLQIAVEQMKLQIAVEQMQQQQQQSCARV